MGDSVFANKPNPFHIIKAVETTAAKLSNWSNNYEGQSQLQFAENEGKFTDVARRELPQGFNL